DAVKRNLQRFEPQKPNTIARSLAIGNPADGPYALKLIRACGGWAEDVSDPEIVSAIKLLAESEGIFTETAGGVSVAVTKNLIAQGRIQTEEAPVLPITGNGLKPPDAIPRKLPASQATPPRLEASLPSLDAHMTPAPQPAAAGAT